MSVVSGDLTVYCFVSVMTGDLTVFLWVLRRKTERYFVLYLYE